VTRVRSQDSDVKKVHEIDGYLVETDSTVRLLTGPVVGEVGRVWPGANPTIAIYNATSSLARFENKNVFLCNEK
jgi:hypothetical protein